MARKRTSAISRWTVGIVKAAMLLALAGVTGLSVSDQDSARMARLRRRPRQLPVRRREADHQVQCEPAPGGLDVRRRPDRLQSARRARGRLRPRPERRFRGARCGDRKADLDPRGCSGLQQSRRELLGEQGRQGPPSDFQLEQLPPGDRRANRADRFPRSEWTAAWICEWAWTAIRRRSTSKPAYRGAYSRTSSSWARRPIRSTPRRPATFGRSTYARGPWCGPFTPCRGPASSATTPGPRTRGKPSAAPTTGESSRSTRNAASSTSPPRAPSTTSMEGIDKGANLFARLPARTRCQDRQASLAFPDGPPRHLGPRQQFGPAVDDHPPERPEHRCRRHGQQDRLPLCV